MKKHNAISKLPLLTLAKNSFWPLHYGKSIDKEILALLIRNDASNVNISL